MSEALNTRCWTLASEIRRFNPGTVGLGGNLVAWVVKIRQSWPRPVFQSLPIQLNVTPVSAGERKYKIYSLYQTKTIYKFNTYFGAEAIIIAVTGPS